MVIFRAFLFIFFRPPDPKSEKKIPINQLIKKFWPYHALNYIDHTAHMILVHCKSL